MKRFVWIAAIAILCVAIGLSWLSRGNTPPGPNPYEIIASLDLVHPGRGEDRLSNGPADFDMSYAVFSSAAAIMGDEARTKLGADFLVKSAAHNAKIGWRLPYPWDAFQDGSINPAETVYGINTANGVRALIDAWGMTGDERYKRTAIEALDYYQEFRTKTDVGTFFWYSDQASDAIAVVNVTSLLMGQYARAAALWGRNDYRRIADEAFSEIWSQRKTSSEGMFWLYSRLPTAAPNDSVHAAIVVQGLLDYRRATKVEFDLEPSFKYLASFLSLGTSHDYTRGSGMSASVLALPAQLWGLGMLAYTLAEGGKVEPAYLAAREMDRYIGPSGKLLTVPNGRYDNRQLMHALLGLARLHN